MKKVKVIKIDVDKCNGCRACEAICSAFHAAPKYSSTNPERSRIRVLFDPLKDVYVPVLAGEYTEAECNGRDVYTIDGKQYDECSFCRASCPSRKLFKDPDSDLPLKCDMCGKGGGGGGGEEAGRDGGRAGVTGQETRRQDGEGCPGPDSQGLKHQGERRGA
jgi:ferredoxin